MDGSDVTHVKDVLGHFLSGVVIVSAQTESGPAGFTCQAFGSFSLEPPSVFFAAARSSTSWGRIRGAAVVAISVLSVDQSDLARLFATTGVDKFAAVPWDSGPHGSPLVTGAIAHFEGVVRSARDYGDHDVVVVDLSYAVAHPGQPLAYFRGAFRSLA